MEPTTIEINQYGTLTVTASNARIIVPPTKYTMHAQLVNDIMLIRFYVTKHENYGDFEIEIHGRNVFIDYRL